MTDTSESPYAVPQADLEVQRDPGDLSTLPRFSTWLVLLLSIVTLGFYCLWWIFDRTRKFNSISEDKVSMRLVISYIVIVLMSVVAFLSISKYAPTTTISGFQADADIKNSVNSLLILSSVVMLFWLFNTISFILLEIWAFKFRNRLNSLTHSHGQKTWAGGVMTFFFTVLYMSYKINQHLDRRS